MEKPAAGPDFKVHLALLYVQISFGGFSVFGKYVLGHVDPLTVAALRVLFAGPLLMLLALRFDHHIPSLRDMPKLALLGLLGVFINQVLFITGLSHTTAINASILMPSIPVFTAAAAIALGVERLSFRRGTGIVLSVIGALVILDVANFSISADTAFGNLLILINCLSYSLFLVLAKPVLRRIPPLTLTAWAFVFGGIGVVTVSFPSLVNTDFSVIPQMAWIGLAYIVLLPTLINYVVNTRAVHRSTSSLVAAYTTLQPVVATVLAMLLLDERFGMRELAGFTLIIAGLLWISRRAGAISLSTTSGSE